MKIQDDYEFMYKSIKPNKKLRLFDILSILFFIISYINSKIYAIHKNLDIMVFPQNFTLKINRVFKYDTDIDCKLSRDWGSLIKKDNKWYADFNSKIFYEDRSYSFKLICFDKQSLAEVDISLQFTKYLESKVNKFTITSNLLPLYIYLDTEYPLDISDKGILYGKPDFFYTNSETERVYIESKSNYYKKVPNIKNYDKEESILFCPYHSLLKISFSEKKIKLCQYDHNYNFPEKPLITELSLMDIEGDILEYYCDIHRVFILEKIKSKTYLKFGYFNSNNNFLMQKIPINQTDLFSNQNIFLNHYYYYRDDIGICLIINKTLYWFIQPKGKEIGLEKIIDLQDSLKLSNSSTIRSIDVLTANIIHLVTSSGYFKYNLYYNYTIDSYISSDFDIQMIQNNTLLDSQLIFGKNTLRINSTLFVNFLEIPLKSLGLEEHYFFRVKNNIVLARNIEGDFEIFELAKTGMLFWRKKIKVNSNNFTKKSNSYRFKLIKLKTNIFWLNLWNNEESKVWFINSEENDLRIKLSQIPPFDFPNYYTIRSLVKIGNPDYYVTSHHLVQIIQDERLEEVGVKEKFKEDSRSLDIYNHFDFQNHFLEANISRLQKDIELETEITFFEKKVDKKLFIGPLFETFDKERYLKVFSLDETGKLIMVLGMINKKIRYKNYKDRRILVNLTKKEIEHISIVFLPEYDKTFIFGATNFEKQKLWLLEIDEIVKTKSKPKFLHEVIILYNQRNI